MCLILDANKYSDFLNPNNQDMKPVRDWVENLRGKIAYAPTQKMESELNEHKKMRKKFDDFRQAGRIKLFSKDKVQSAMKNLQNLKSDDPHIIALAQVSGVKLLVSGDTNLHKDFSNRNLIKKGSIYQTKEHKHLLKRDLCP